MQIVLQMDPFAQTMMGPGSRASVGTFHSQLSETVSSWFDVLTSCGPCDRIERHHKSSSRRSPWAETLPEVAGVGAQWPGKPKECKTWTLTDTATSASPRVLVSPIRATGVYGYVHPSASRSNYLAFGPSASRSDYLAFGDQDLATADAKPATGFGAPTGASRGGPFVSTISPSTFGSSADHIGLMSDFDVILATDAAKHKVGHSPTPGPTVASNAPLHSRMTTQDETAFRRKVDKSRKDAAAPENSPQTTPQTTPQMNPSATPKTLQPIREHSTSERPSCSPTGEQIATRLAMAPPSKREFSPRSGALAGEPGYADVAISPGRPAQAGESELQRIFQERQQRAARKRDSFLACEKERERAKVEEEREHERTREREQRERREQEQARDRAQRERELRQAVAMRAATAVSPRHHEEEGVQAETEDSGGRKGGRESEFTMEGTDEDWDHSSDSEVDKNELGAC